ncbi:MAG TPA: hypothetical protein VMB20_09600 [Candidatus Acidoferrum sp.]|nr:hypothetical protein [Candidatus Acidoferrum sp.]
MWHRRVVGIASLVAAIALSACGGGTSNMPASASTDSATAPDVGPPSPLQLTQAPTATINRIDAEKRRDDLLGPWQFEEPLQVGANYTLSVPSYVRSCTPQIPLLAPWYLTLETLEVPQAPVTIPACKFTTKNVSVANFYLVQIDVDLQGLTVAVTPLSSPVVVSGNQWTFNAIQKIYTFNPDNIYSFWVANYTGTGTPP